MFLSRRQPLQKRYFKLRLLTILFCSYTYFVQAATALTPDTGHLGKRMRFTMDAILEPSAPKVPAAYIPPPTTAHILAAMDHCVAYAHSFSLADICEFLQDNVIPYLPFAPNNQQILASTLLPTTPTPHLTYLQRLSALCGMCMPQQDPLILMCAKMTDLIVNVLWLQDQPAILQLISEHARYSTDDYPAYADYLLGVTHVGLIAKIAHTTPDSINTQVVEAAITFLYNTDTPSLQSLRGIYTATDPDYHSNYTSIATHTAENIQSLLNLTIAHNTHTIPHTHMAPASPAPQPPANNTSMEAASAAYAHNLLAPRHTKEYTMLAIHRAVINRLMNCSTHLPMDILYDEIRTCLQQNTHAEHFNLTTPSTSGVDGFLDLLNTLQRLDGSVSSRPISSFFLSFITLCINAITHLSILESLGSTHLQDAISAIPNDTAVSSIERSLCGHWRAITHTIHWHHLCAKTQTSIEEKRGSRPPILQCIQDSHSKGAFPTWRPSILDVPELTYLKNLYYPTLQQHDRSACKLAPETRLILASHHSRTIPPLCEPETPGDADYETQAFQTALDCLLPTTGIQDFRIRIIRLLSHTSIPAPDPCAPNPQWCYDVLNNCQKFLIKKRATNATQSSHIVLIASTWIHAFIYRDAFPKDAQRLQGDIKGTLPKVQEMSAVWAAPIIRHVKSHLEEKCPTIYITNSKGLLRDILITPSSIPEVLSNTLQACRLGPTERVRKQSVVIDYQALCTSTQQLFQQKFPEISTAPPKP